MKKIIVFMLFLVCLSCQNQTDVDKATVEDPIKIDDSTDEIDNSTDEIDDLTEILASVDSREIDDPHTFFCFRDPIAIEDLEPTNLAGTKWKLVGTTRFTPTGTIGELEPIDCENCFTLTFDTDYTAIPYNISRSWSKIDLTPTGYNRCPYVMFEDIGITETYEKDGKDYFIYFPHLLFNIESFTVTNDELKLFYTRLTYKHNEDGSSIMYVIKDKNHFTLFKRIEE